VAPERIRIHVRGPRRLTSIPMLVPNGRTTLDPTGELRILYSAPVDSAFLEGIVRFEVAAEGGCARTLIPYQVKTQRPPMRAIPGPFVGARMGRRRSDSSDWSI
jgi:hypothetical protein